MDSTHQPVILHLSDLHFGCDRNEKDRIDRDLALKGLLKCLNRFEADWKPHCVCISGDIGWSGSQRDYDEAEQWIHQLLTNLSLSAEALFVCPGNHDVNRNEAKKHARSSKHAEADEMLEDPRLDSARC